MSAKLSSFLFFLFLIPMKHIAVLKTVKYSFCVHSNVISLKTRWINMLNKKLRSTVYEELTQTPRDRLQHYTLFNTSHSIAL